MMQNLVLNKTPIRTSKSYKINDVKLKNVCLPSEKATFNNEEIQSTGALINENIEFAPLTFGNGDELFDNLQKYCNSAVNIVADNKNTKTYIHYTFDDDNTQLSSVINIMAKKDAFLSIVYKSETDKNCFNNSVVYIEAQNGAKVHVEIVNLTNEHSNNFLSVQSDAKENSAVELIVVDMGAKNSVVNVFSQLSERKAKSDVNTIYIAKNDELKDYNYICHLKGRKSDAQINVQGALLDKAVKNFKGTIDFKKGCKKAKGKEQEFCMLLSNDCKSTALPMLLCTEDDVEGEHSAASGQVDAKQVFYLMSRGFEKQEAIKLLVKAKYYEILDKIIDNKLRNDIIEEIDRRII